jgi:hypothetical protein
MASFAIIGGRLINGQTPASAIGVSGGSGRRDRAESSRVQRYLHHLDIRNETWADRV